MATITVESDSAAQADSGLTHAAGVVVLAFGALGLYLFLGTASAAAGGPAYPLGKPLVK
jgi:hypothetical protein